MTNQIYPCLWFDGNAKQAAELYCSIFSNSKITTDTHMVVNWELNGQKFMGLNGGPMFKINPSISIFVVCETEKETNEVWQKLSEGGSAFMPLDKYAWSEKYGWVQDKFGMSWQISYGKLSDVGQKFTPSFLFAGNQYGNGEKAVKFYTSVFQPSSVAGILLYKEGDKQPAGNLMHAQFSLLENVVMAMDGPGDFNFSEGLSLVVNCETQKEIDYYWQKLTADGGEESMCGWLKDKYGVSWQIIPSILGELMTDLAKGGKVMQEVMKMRKLDIEKLTNA